MLKSGRQAERYWGRKLKKAINKLGMARDKDEIEKCNKEVQICNMHLKGVKK